MQLDLATAEYIGAREQQQDLAAALPLVSGALLVLADGLGGHESGAEAARIVVTTFKEAGASGRFKQPGSRRQALREVLDLANARIAAGVNPAHGHRGMASTVVAAVVSHGEVSWVSVGDSHLYIWRDGRLHKLNEDHSQAGLMVKSGQYQPGDPEVLAVKSVLVSALTGRKLEIVDLPQSSFRLEPGDVLMLASDGLNTLADAEIAEIIDDVREAGAIKLSTTLLESVRSRRLERQDNTTVVVARVLEPERITVAAAPIRRPEGGDVDELEDDAGEERTQRVIPEPVQADQGAEASAAIKPAMRSTPASVPDVAPAEMAEADARGDTLQTPAEANAVSDPEIKPREPTKPSSGRPRRERPVLRGVGEPTGEPDAQALPLGPAAADPSPDVVLSASRPRVDPPPPRAGSPNPGLTRTFAVLVIALLLASGIAIAAFKPGWLSGVLPRFGETGTPQPTTTTGAATRSAPEPTGAPASSAPIAAEPAGKAQAEGTAAPPRPLNGESQAQSPSVGPGTPPLVEAERPVPSPDRNRGP